MAQPQPGVSLSGEYRLLAIRQRERADSEPLQNVRRKFEVSAERWELLAEHHDAVAQYGAGLSSEFPALKPLRTPPGVPKSVRASTLMFDPPCSVVMANKARIRLTDQQYALLEFLNLKDGATVSRAALLDHLYFGANRPEPKIIDVLVCILRKKLAAVCDGERCIETVRGTGYRLAMPQAS